MTDFSKAGLFFVNKNISFFFSFFFQETVIEPVQETNNFAQKELVFTTIADLEGIHIAEKESIYVNMMVYVREVGEINQFQSSRTGKDLTKRDITVADHTNAAVTFFL